MTEECPHCKHSFQSTNRNPSSEGPMELALPLLGILAILGWYGYTLVASAWNTWWWVILPSVGMLFYATFRVLRRLFRPKFDRFRPPIKQKYLPRDSTVGVTDLKDRVPHRASGARSAFPLAVEARK